MCSEEHPNETMISLLSRKYFLSTIVRSVIRTVFLLTCLEFPGREIMMMEIMVTVFFHNFTECDFILKKKGTFCLVKNLQRLDTPEVDQRFLDL